MKKRIRLAAVAAALAIVAWVQVALAAEITISIAHSAAEATAQHTGSLALKKYLEENSGGRIQVNILANVLGGDRETIEGVQEGSIDIIMTSPAPQVNFVPNAAIFDLPFHQATIEDIEKTHTNPQVLSILRQHYAKAGIHVLGINNCGFRITSTNKAVNTPKDLEGVSIRTMENRFHIMLWRALGANPTPIAFNEVYTALQQRVVDGQENPMELIWSQKFFEQQSHVIKTNHLPHTLVWIMNKNRYDSLPDDLRKLVDDGMVVTLKASSNYIFGNNEMYERELRARGLQIIDLSPEQLLPFRDRVKNVWEELQKNIDPEVYDAYVKALE
ncbi:MAG: TRAP transporter substrate-binding protein, partial [Planctomycetes bacterium]|nr:TRAP transporter substrate-binding protein [Planctomycetota bacterium]